MYLWARLNVRFQFVSKPMYEKKMILDNKSFILVCREQLSGFVLRVLYFVVFNGKCPSLPAWRNDDCQPYALEWQTYFSGPFTGVYGNRLSCIFPRRVLRSRRRVVVFRCFPRQKPYLVGGTYVSSSVSSVLYCVAHDTNTRPTLRCRCVCTHVNVD